MAINTTNSLVHLLEQLAQQVATYIKENNEESDIEELEEEDLKDQLIDFLEAENANLPDHETPMDFLNETIDSLIND